MRLVVDLAAVLNAGAVVLGFLWRRRRNTRRRLSNIEYVRQLERENAEMDEITARMGAGPSDSSDRLRS